MRTLSRSTGLRSCEFWLTSADDQVSERRGTSVAQTIQAVLTDDLDGSSAAGTVRFGLDGTEYEIDLTAEHARRCERRWPAMDGCPAAGPGRPAAPEADTEHRPAWPGHHRIRVRARVRGAGKSTRKTAHGHLPNWRPSSTPPPPSSVPGHSQSPRLRRLPHMLVSERWSPELRAMRVS